MTSVHIVLPAFNGAPHLPAQLSSLLDQTHRDWTLILSDDGSGDATRDIAQQMIPADRLLLTHGPQRGVALNAWSGLKRVPTGSYLAFCDQDDVWHSEKIARAIAALRGIRGPAAYSAGRMVVDAKLRDQYADHRQAPGRLEQLVFRNPVAAHTCVFSPEAVQILQRCPPSPQVPFHDWWAALVLTGIGARWVHDPMPVLRYRQHAGNLIGAHGGRLHTIWTGRYRDWVTANCQALARHVSLLSPGARAQLARTQDMLRRTPFGLYSGLIKARMAFASARMLD